MVSIIISFLSYKKSIGTKGLEKTGRCHFIHQHNMKQVTVCEREGIIITARLLLSKLIRKKWSKGSSVK